MDRIQCHDHVDKVKQLRVQHKVRSL